VHAAGGLLAAVGNGASLVRQAVPDTDERIVLAGGTDDLAAFFGAVRVALGDPPTA
jgi:protease I